MEPGICAWIERKICQWVRRQESRVASRHRHKTKRERDCENYRSSQVSTRRLRRETHLTHCHALLSTSVITWSFVATFHFKAPFGLLESAGFISLTIRTVQRRSGKRYAGFLSRALSKNWRSAWRISQVITEAGVIWIVTSSHAANTGPTLTSASAASLRYFR
jgi:hypothetical protein